MPTQAKIQEVERLKERLERATAVVLADYRGLTANEMVELREKFTKEGLEYRVVKDTLARIAADEAGIEGLSEMFAGPISIALGYEDPAVAFKLSEECRKTYSPRYELRGGVFEGALVAETEVKRYALLPSREELLAKLVMMLQSPMRALAVMLKAKIRELATVLSEVAKTRPDEPGETPTESVEESPAEAPAPAESAPEAEAEEAAPAPEEKAADEPEVASDTQQTPDSEDEPDSQEETEAEKQQEPQQEEEE